MSKLADPRFLQSQRTKHFAAMSPVSILRAADVCVKLFLTNDLLGVLLILECFILVGMLYFYAPITPYSPSSF